MPTLKTTYETIDIDIMTINQETQGSTAVVDIPIPDVKPAQKETWQEIGARKRAALLASIPTEWLIPADLLPPASQDDVTTWPETSGWFTPDELAITDLLATELVSRLASGALTSVDVTKAFCKRASAAHQLVRYINTRRDFTIASSPFPLPKRTYIIY